MCGWVVGGLRGCGGIEARTALRCKQIGGRHGKGEGTGREETREGGEVQRGPASLVSCTWIFMPQLTGPDIPKVKVNPALSSTRIQGLSDALSTKLISIYTRRVLF